MNPVNLNRRFWRTLVYDRTLPIGTNLIQWLIPAAILSAVLAVLAVLSVD